MPQTIVVTGGAGYIGAPLSQLLLAQGHEVRVLDALVHGQDDVAAELAAAGARLLPHDVRDEEARRAALAGADAVVHLAAVVGDPACAREPELAHEVNVTASHALIEDARRAGVTRFVMASTCSNYGRMADPTVPIDEDGELAPVSLYARQKVEIEQRLLAEGALVPTCLRFATIYGVAPRMRFDLTVNEFTRDLWAGRELEVFGEQFWRPYVHVADAGRAVAQVLAADPRTVGHAVFNVGHSDENFTKRDLVALITARTPNGSVSHVRRDEDPRDYKVRFDRIRDVLGFATTMTVAGGIDEILSALERRAFGDPFDARYRNTP